MASEIRVDKINSLSGVGTVTLSPTGIDIAGITTAATLRATTGIVTSLTAGSLTSLGAVSGTTGTFTGDVDIADKIVHTGDTNTSIRFADTDTVTVETAGSERTRVNSSGQLLINTTDGTGAYNLVVADPSNGDTGMTFRSSASSQQYIRFADGTSGGAENIGEIEYNHGTNSLAIDTNGSEAVRIDSSGRVMIGNTNASTMSSSSDDLVIGNTTGDHGITVIAGDDSSGRIMFADTYTSGTGTYEGQILYYHQNNVMNFYSNYTNNTNVAMQLGGDQNQLFVGIDKSSTTTYDNRSAYFHRTTGNSNYISITSGTSYDCGIVFGDTIANAAGNYESYITHSNNGNDLTLHVNRGNNSRYLRVKSSTGNVEIGGGNLVLASGYGVDFSATGNSNGSTNSELFDDYEEGTFTPSFGGGISASSYYNQYGFYTKIGREVFVYIYLRANSASTGSANVTITNLPYTCNSTSGHEGGGYITYTNGFFGTTVDNEHFHPMPWVSLGNSYAVFHTPADGNNVTGSDTVPGNKYCIFHLRYVN